MRMVNYSQATLNTRSYTEVHVQSSLSGDSIMYPYNEKKIHYGYVHTITSLS